MSILNAVKAIVRTVVPTRIIHFGMRTWIRAGLQFNPEQMAVYFEKEASTYVRRGDYFLTFPWLLDQLHEKSRDDASAYFYVHEPDKLPSICAPADDFQALAEKLLRVAASNDVAVYIEGKSKQLQTAVHHKLLSSIVHSRFVVVEIRYLEQTLKFRLEKWVETDGVLVAPRENVYARKIYLDGNPSVERFFSEQGSNLADLFDCVKDDICTFDVDIVYTWVNSEDEEWQALRSQYSRENGDGHDALSQDRFKNRNELKYSIRSVLEHASWVRKIFVVSNCAPPKWLDTSNSKIQWVSHEDVIDSESLPTFSSHAIESSLHRISGLADKFIYFNDDFFLTKDVEKMDYFLPSGLAKIRLEPYGTVHGDPDEAHPDYLNAARNGQKLLAEKFEKTVTQLHTHSPHPMEVSTAHAAEAAFQAHYSETRSNKFRKITDISPTSFFYPHFAYLTGRAIKVASDTQLIQANKDYRKLFSNLLDHRKSKNAKRLPLTICVNDGGGSAGNPSWNQAVIDFLDLMYPKPSEVEHTFMESLSAPSSED